MKRLSYLIFLCILLTLNLHSQKELHDYGFDFFDSIEVKKNSIILNHPWNGGMNFCHFSAVDLNFDEIKDLIVFDRSGNRKMVYINSGITDSSSYKLDHGLKDELPAFKEWVIFIDFNNDGKEDIFTYTTGGIAVYQNTSFEEKGIEFEKITKPFIYSLHGTVYTNLYVTPVDLPAISDIDNDGDLDILTFWGLGKYVQFHKNFSMENYGHADSLVYELEESCWGNFEESEDNNQLTLNITCPFKSFGECKPDIENYPKDRHTGSTFLAIDLDADNDKDLLLGDIDYNSLFKLTNGGDQINANITSQDTSFPVNYPIELYSFPAPSYLDVDNDGLKDLLVSPFDNKTSYPVSDNDSSIWFYKNTGANNAPVFEFQKKNFLQDEMIDVGAGAYPVIFDYNNDGLADIFISNFGYRDSSYYQNYTLYSTYRSQIKLLKNTGTSNSPFFEIITEDFASIANLKIESAHPTFGDIDNDGDNDMIIGNSEGTLSFFENTSLQLDTFIFNPLVADYMGIDAGKYSTPQLIDINRDDLLDLLIGNKDGSIQYYRNNGSANSPSFTLITETLGGVNVQVPSISNYGYSVPYFFENQIGEYNLFVGSESGRIFYYKNIDNNLNGNFILFDNNLLYINEGYRTGVCAFNFNNDGFLDMIIGNYAGGISYFKGVYPPDMQIKTVENLNKDLKIYPNPANKFIIIESKKTNCTKFEIVNLTGQVILQMNAENKNYNQINISGLSQGIYILKITWNEKNTEGTSLKKIIKTTKLT